MSKASVVVFGFSGICVGGATVFTNLSGRAIPGWLQWTGVAVFGIAVAISGIRDFLVKKRA
jgi:hypothetical protein